MTQTPPPTDAELVERLRAVESSRPDVLGISTNWYRNPDGPEAADRIESLEAENARLREALAELRWEDRCNHLDYLARTDNGE